MVIIRTDGGGTCYQNDRLKGVSEILTKVPFQNQILRLHDHKGILTVLWNTNPTIEEMQIVQGIWFLYNEFEINHEVL